MRRGPKPQHFGCMVEGCEGEHAAPGYCPTHYGRFQRTGDPLKLVRRRLKPQILDVLDADGGWLTVQGLNLLLPDVVEESIRVCLHRLAADGAVECRRIELAGARGPLGYEVRVEWRVNQ